MTSPVDILKAKILVVDDSTDNATLLARALNVFGFTNVSITNDPEKVYGLHIKNDFDLILLDMHMPRINGIDVMRQLKEIEQGRYLPVLAMTGDSDFKIAALQTGARDFITKPFNLVELEVRVRNMLEVRLLYNAVQEQNRVQWELAMHDELTGLPNRRLLLDRTEKMMQHALRTKQLMALMYLDLDGFKQINDELGHKAGDEILKMVAQRLLRAVRREDTVSRLGGDEFVLLLSDLANLEAVERIARKVLDYMTTPFMVQDTSAVMSASIGIALYSSDLFEDAEALIACADKGMYQAKNSGKNRFFISNRPATFA
jgi:two-component system cell cycle response regulator